MCDICSVYDKQCPICGESVSYYSNYLDNITKNTLIESLTFCSNCGFECEFINGKRRISPPSLITVGKLFKFWHYKSIFNKKFMKKQKHSSKY